MRNTPLEFAPPLSASQMADLRLAASQMTGPTRRALQAEMTLKYCQGHPLQAATVFGWGRHTVALGLSERRTGIMGLGAQAACSGRKRWEDQHPEVAAVLRQLAKAHAQQDPTFRPTLASTRLTVKAALEALAAQGESAEPWPSPSTMAAVRNRLGFRVRQVVKAKPQKKSAETEAMLAHIEKKTRRPRPRPTSNACVSLVKPPWRLVTSPVAASRGVIIGRVITTWACTSNLVPVGLWMQTGRGCPSPLGALARPAMSSWMPSKPGGRRWIRASRWP